MTSVSRTAAARHDLARMASVPREVRLTGGGKAVAALSVMFAAAAVAAAIGLSIVHLRQEETRGIRLREGVHTTAVVARAEQTRGDNPRWVVTYRYVTPDAAYEPTVRLPERDRRRLAEGDRLDVVYLRSQPESSWVEGDEPGVLPIWVVPIVSAVLLALAGLTALVVRRERVLLTEGRFAEARVASTTKVHRQHHHAYRIDYEFTTLSGMTVSASTEKRRVPAGTGATMRVVYHRDNPRWNAIYPLALVTPAQHLMRH